MKSYTTFAGAQRAAKGKPILRLLDDPVELFVVLPSANTRIMAVDGRKGHCDGSIPYFELSVRR
jgi:hypothetical protein